MQVKQCKVKEAKSDGELVDQYCIDLVGPILPRNLQLLTKFLNYMQQPYSIQDHKCEATLSFNHFNN